MKIIQPFCGELFVEDPQLGKKQLYICVEVNYDDIVTIRLYNEGPPFKWDNWMGDYSSAWLLKRVKTRLLATEYELTLLNEEPNVKARCLMGHKFGRMVEDAINNCV